ncbi:hypothetical protein L3X38_044156 [Prunus dulcis]|uniref:Branched-chain-amino-acid aminotransferase n=1 Tax=Prunus dulcis TaxID=3755 RepID=A0AAD4YMX6_PRUDU|nr:hypothetical protein L3X38_044156 [Prunus dulcis]
MLLFTTVVFGPQLSHPAIAWGSTGPKRTGPPSSFHPNQSQPLEPLVIAGKCKNQIGFNSKFTELVRTPPVTIFVDPGKSLLHKPKNAGQNSYPEDKTHNNGLFECLKAYRRQDGGIQLFRPEQNNALCMKNGADRLCMPSPSVMHLLMVFEAVSKAKAKGFADVLFLDAATGKNVEEVSSCNVFIVKGNVVLTPPTNGTILPGITRKSIIEITLHLNFQSRSLGPQESKRLWSPTVGY